tara:strand:+ start:93 stop:482 length:390 start_codon:yes stop_codon:yes gene_type:complete
MSTIVFNREIKRLISNENHPVLNFIKDEFKNSNRNKSYYGFFDSFLFNYGVLTLGYSPIINGNKYVPYVNCSRNNIFREEKGITDLSQKAENMTECQKIMAEYLIGRLKCLNVENFKSWNSELNYEILA